MSDYHLLRRAHVRMFPYENTNPYEEMEALLADLSTGAINMSKEQNEQILNDEVGNWVELVHGPNDNLMKVTATLSLIEPGLWKVGDTEFTLYDVAWIQTYTSDAEPTIRVWKSRMTAEEAEELLNP